MHKEHLPPESTWPKHVGLSKRILEDKKATDIQVFHTPGSSLSPYTMIASGTSTRHLHALSQALYQALKETGTVAAIEGDNQNQWILLDVDDVIVHLFLPEVRAHYDLESLQRQMISKRASQLSKTPTPDRS
jgi:ribosome-associated protein